MELLEQFRRSRERMALVIDEYGVVQGMVTPHDLLEAITGELSPEAVGEPGRPRAATAPGCWMA